MRGEDFRDAVAFVGKFLPRRAPSPVLSGIRISSDGSSVEFAVFDYETAAHTTVQAAGDPFAALVDGSLLKDAAKLVKAETVTLRTEGSRVVVEHGGSHAMLQTMPLDDYPELPVVSTPIAFIEGADFAAGVKRVVPAAGTDDTLPFLTGVRMELHGDFVRWATTDRYRLAVHDMPGAAENNEEIHPLIYSKTLKLIGQVFAKSNAVSIFYAEGRREGAAVYEFERVGFSDGTRSVVVRPLEGEFIKYELFFPAEYAHHAEVNIKQLVSVVKAAATYAERNTPVRLTFESGTVRVEAGSGDAAQFSQSMSATYNGDSFSVAFNPAYLLDGLNGCGGAEVHFNFTTQTKPAVLQPATGGEVDDTFRYLLVPIRLSS
jgi:DNA polymerase-3 subunit beta